MSKYDDRRCVREHIRREAQAEFEFGDLLETNGIDIDELIGRLRITRSDLNAYIHYRYGLAIDRPASADRIDAALNAILGLPSGAPIPI